MFASSDSCIGSQHVRVDPVRSAARPKCLPLTVCVSQSDDSDSVEVHSHKLLVLTWRDTVSVSKRDGWPCLKAQTRLTTRVLHVLHVLQ